MEALRDAALQLLPEPVAHRLRDSAELAELLQARFTESVAERAAYDVPDEVLLRALVRLLPASGELASLREVSAADLTLVLACAAGHPAALAEFDRRFTPALTAVLRRVDPSPGFVDEALQAVRERLLLVDGQGAPRIASYSGTGSLSKWVGAVALRVALNLRRGERPQVALDEQLANELPMEGSGPELSLLKSQYRDAFQASFRAALGGLTDQEVNVLRLHYLGGVSLERLGETYGAHRATVARWIARAKEQLVEGTQRELRARLHVGEEEFQDIMDLVRSQLVLSLSRVMS